MLIKIRDKDPKISNNCFVADSSRIIGDVEISEFVSVWYGAVIRGDDDYITIDEYTNIQDNAVLHVDINKPLTVGAGVTVGHSAVLHGCTVEDNVLIGMGSIVLDGAIIGEGSIIGANALVAGNKVIPARSLVLGSPGRVIRSVTDEELERIKWNADHYKKKIEYYVDD